MLALNAQETAIFGDVGMGAIVTAMRYGKAVGHLANLNLGDCFAYACAQTQGATLLYKGDDFALTDID